MRTSAQTIDAVASGEFGLDDLLRTVNTLADFARRAQLHRCSIPSCGNDVSDADSVAIDDDGFSSPEK